jgi:hypothetical protein
MKGTLSKYRKQLVFLMDLFIMAACAVILFLASPLGNGTGHRDLTPLIINLAIWFCCIILFNILFHTYDSLWRYAEGYRFFGSPVIKSFEEFKRMSDVIIANRFGDELADVKDKVYTRDLYFRD